MNRLVAFLFSLGVLFACNKQLPDLPDIDDEPVFYCNGVLNGEDISFKAGAGSELILPDYLNIHTIKTGFFSPNSSLTLYLHGNNMFDRLDSKEIELFSSLEYAYIPKDSLFATISMDDLTTTSNVTDFKWFLNGEIAQEVQFNNPGVYNVSLEVNNQSQNTITNQVVIGYKSNSVFKLNATYVNELVYATIEEMEEGISSIDWYYASQVFHTTTPYVSLLPVAGATILTAKVKFNNGIERTRSILVGNETNPFVEDFVYILESTNKYEFNYKTVLTFQLNDEVYTSLHTIQPSENKMSILDGAVFTDKLTLKQLYKLHVIMPIKLTKLSTSEIVDANFEVTFALPFAK